MSINLVLIPLVFWLASFAVLSLGKEPPKHLRRGDPRLKIATGLLLCGFAAYLALLFLATSSINHAE